MLADVAGSRRCPSSRGGQATGARILIGLRARIAAKLLAPAAGVALSHRLGQPTRAFAALAV